MKKIFVFILLINTFSFVYSVRQYGGLPGYFLDLGVGARALGMGRSFVAVADDVSAVYWNPAGLSRLERGEISLTHISLFEDTYYNCIAAASPFNKNWTLGYALIQQYTGGIIKRDESNIVTGEMSDQNTAMFFSGSHPVNREIIAGFSIKMINKVFGSINKSWFGLDMSALYSPLDYVDIGLNFQNSLRTVFERSDDEDYIVPIKTRLGAAVKPLDDNLIISADIESVSDYFLKFHSGIEWCYRGMLKLRGGYDAGNLTFGFGLSYNNYGLDYALQNNPLGLSHRITVDYKFGKNVSKIKESKSQVEKYEIYVNAMKEIPVAVYHLFADRNVSVINVKIGNTTKKEMKFKISYRLGPGNIVEEKEITVPAEQTKNIDLIPVLTQDEIRALSVVPTPGNIFVEVSRIIKKEKAMSVFKNSYPVILLPYDQFTPQIIDAKEEIFNLSDTLVNWVTSNDRNLSGVLSKASDKGAGLNPPVKINGSDYLSQIKLIYDTLQEDYKIVCINERVAYQNTQRIKLPSDTLQNKGNSIELSVLFAGLLESIEIDPILVVFRKDSTAAVGWKTQINGKEEYNLFAATVFGEDFKNGISQGEKLIEDTGLQKEFKEGIPFDKNGIFSKEPDILILDVKKIRAHVPPSPYIPR
ncbi:MAG: PorV/PorQ family protein [Elusimicrobia bacterium]|nr:PorV/PorQ family protein [Elusimicrobiota bacterium]